MLGFWLAAAGLLLVALAFVLVPLLRERQRTGSKAFSGILAGVAMIPVSVGLYLFVTTFDSDLASAVAQNQVDLLDQLAARLTANPDDAEGWELLGRSYLQFGDYERAKLALAEAWARNDSPGDMLKLSYAQVLLFTEAGAAESLAGDLVEEVLRGAPNDQTALFLGGLVAAERDQPSLAASRFSALLATNPPPDIAEILVAQLQALGQSGSVAARPVPQPAAAADGPVIEVDVSVADSIELGRFGAGARLFVIARASDMPAPVAVESHPLSALPGRFALSNADAMLPGRLLSNYNEVTVIARISNSGEPTAQSGDVFAETLVDPNAGSLLTLVIDQVVP